MKPDLYAVLALIIPKMLDLRSSKHVTFNFRGRLCSSSGTGNGRLELPFGFSVTFSFPRGAEFLSEGGGGEGMKWRHGLEVTHGRKPRDRYPYRGGDKPRAETHGTGTQTDRQPIQRKNRMDRDGHLRYKQKQRTTGTPRVMASNVKRN